MMQLFSASIKKIEVSGNFVGTPNQSMFKRFINLEWLDLSDTMLTEFNFNILKCEKTLQVLLISSNNLKYLNKTFLLENFNNLNAFSVFGNRLQSTPEVIQRLRPSIEIFHLSDNFMGKLNPTTFRHLSNLYELKLSKINLSILDVNAFDELKDLQNLHISHNNMENTNFTISLSRLRRFHANNCEIKNSSEVIQYLGSNLGELNLFGNFIGKLNSGSFKSLVKLWNVN